MQVFEETFPLPAAFLPQRQGKEQELRSPRAFSSGLELGGLSASSESLGLCVPEGQAPAHTEAPKVGTSAVVWEEMTLLLPEGPPLQGKAPHPAVKVQTIIRTGVQGSQLPVPCSSLQGHTLLPPQAASW